MPAPKIFYKYRPFTHRLVEQLCEDRIYFADPTTFNDPLDSQPRVVADVEVDALRGILSTLLQERLTQEMTRAAGAIGYRGPRTLEHIALRQQKQVDLTLKDLAYEATDPQRTVAEPEAHAQLLVRRIQQELRHRYTNGVFSLGTRAHCPLMWSHYGDQHRGLCVGYARPAHLEVPGLPPQRVTYGGPREVPASQVAAMLTGDPAAQAFVDQRVLLTKAPEWRYEREWRLLYRQGGLDSPFELREVIFGLRCPKAVRFTVTRALATREPAVRFHEIVEQSDSFRLRKRRLDPDELAEGLPRRGLHVHEVVADFGPVEA